MKCNLYNFDMLDKLNLVILHTYTDADDHSEDPISHTHKITQSKSMNERKRIKQLI